MSVVICQADYEELLLRELTAADVRAAGPGGRGWMEAACGPPEGWDGCFAHVWLAEGVELNGNSVNRLAGGLIDWFAGTLEGERLEQGWPCIFLHASGESGLGRRAGTVRRAFNEGLRRRMGRVARLAVDRWENGPGFQRGAFVVNLKFGRTDPVALLQEVRLRLSPLVPALRIRHLYHDREEFTVMGGVGGEASRE